MEEDEDINNEIYRDAYKNYIDEFYDEDVLDTLHRFEMYEQINDILKRKNYGRYLIKRKREW
jgi:hypothetical protein